MTAFLRQRGGDVVFTANEQTLSVRCKLPDFRLRFVTAAVSTVPYRSADESALYMRFRDFTDAAFEYALRLSAGRFVQTENGIDVYPDKTGEIVFDFNGN